MKPTLAWTLGTAVAILCAPKIAAAYSVESAFAHGCHEDITGQAFQDFLVEVPTLALELPEDQSWQKVARFVLNATQVDWSTLNEEQRFMFASLVIGVRSPDTDGHSIMNLQTLRELHANPDPSGQYMHALRGKADDYAEGDRIAVDGTRANILDLMKTSAYYWSLPPQKQIIKGTFFVDFYDEVKIDVWAPMYYLGMAAHVLQDSFSHAIRADQDALRTVVHVTNFIEAIANDFDEERDGLAHSKAMDQCGDSTHDLVQGAALATIDLFYAARSMFNGTDPNATQLVFDAWLTYRAGCTLTNDFCDNRRWLDQVRREQTAPFLGCTMAARPVPSGAWWWFVPVALLLIGQRRGRQGRA